MSLQPQDLDFMIDGLQCLVCRKVFSSSRVVKRHMLSHKEAKPYTCFYCDYAAARKDVLRSHCLGRHEMSQQEFEMKAGAAFAGVAKRRGRPPAGARDDEGDVLGRSAMEEDVE